MMVFSSVYTTLAGRSARVETALRFARARRCYFGIGICETSQDNKIFFFPISASTAQHNSEFWPNGLRRCLRRYARATFGAPFGAGTPQAVLALQCSYSNFEATCLIFTTEPTEDEWRLKNTRTQELLHFGFRAEPWTLLGPEQLNNKGCVLRRPPSTSTPWNAVPAAEGCAALWKQCTASGD